MPKNLQFIVSESIISEFDYTAAVITGPNCLIKACDGRQKYFLNTFPNVHVYLTRVKREIPISIYNKFSKSEIKKASYICFLRWQHCIQMITRYPRIMKKPCAQTISYQMMIYYKKAKVQSCNDALHVSESPCLKEIFQHDSYWRCVCFLHSLNPNWIVIWEYIPHQLE